MAPDWIFSGSLVFYKHEVIKKVWSKYNLCFVVVKIDVIINTLVLSKSKMEAGRSSYRLIFP